MNAAEARAKSISNLPNLVDLHVTLTKTAIDIDIKEEVRFGRFRTRKILSLPKEIENDVIKQLEIHYQELGYEVDVRDFISNKMFYISWK